MSPTSTRSRAAGTGSTAAAAADAVTSASMTAGRPTLSTWSPAPQAEPELPPSVRRGSRVNAERPGRLRDG